MKFSANLGFLWTDRPLPEAIRAAKSAGFDAIECHWPFDVPIDEMRSVLAETGFDMLGLNTRRGDMAAGDNGLSAIPGREAEALAAIDQAISYAAAVDCKKVHVMAGIASGPEAQETFVAHLRYACDQALAHGITILIEPLNGYDAPGYFLTTVDQAADIIKLVERDNLKIMFDCYHVQLMSGDVSHRLEKLLPLIGHIQFASVPDRGAPDHGELNYDHVFQVVAELGYAAPLGAEYKPGGDTNATLGWLQSGRWRNV